MNSRFSSRNQQKLGEGMKKSTDPKADGKQYLGNRLDESPAIA
jgi:hypothetical protein